MTALFECRSKQRAERACASIRSAFVGLVVGVQRRFVVIGGRVLTGAEVKLIEGIIERVNA